MQRAEQVAAALKMRAAGSSFRRIGAALGVDAATVMRWIRDALAAEQAAEQAAAAAPAALVAAAVRDYRAESHGVLDAVVESNLAAAGTPGNGNVLLRAVEVRARMEGLLAAPMPPPEPLPARVVILRDGRIEDPYAGDGRPRIVVDARLITPPTLLPGDRDRA